MFESSSGAQRVRGMSATSGARALLSLYCLSKTRLSVSPSQQGEDEQGVDVKQLQIADIDIEVGV